MFTILITVIALALLPVALNVALALLAGVVYVIGGAFEWFFDALEKC